MFVTSLTFNKTWGHSPPLPEKKQVSLSTFITETYQQYIPGGLYFLSGDPPGATFHDSTS